MKRLIAYTSISHFGFIALGIFAMTSQGQSGATLYMVNHGFATGALFLVAGFLIARRGSQLIADYGGVQKVAPVLAGLFLIAGLAGLSLPGLSTFVSEFLVLVGTFTRYKVAAVSPPLGIILAAIYILWMYQRTMTGPVREQVKDMPDLRPRELWAVAPLIALHHLLRRLPQAAARHHQPGGPGDDDPGARHRSRARRTRRVNTLIPPCRREPRRDRRPGRLGDYRARRTSSTASSRRCCSSSARPWPASWSRRSRRAGCAAPCTWSLDAAVAWSPRSC